MAAVVVPCWAPQDGTLHEVRYGNNVSYRQNLPRNDIKRLAMYFHYI